MVMTAVVSTVLTSFCPTLIANSILSVRVCDVFKGRHGDAESWRPETRLQRGPAD
jgi:hypothetical protein